ncbi:MAG: FAD-dependent oxidoreductase, partial [Spirulinaceae cyanobacterium]
MHTYEYDLMVIGNTPEARYAALLAAQQSAASPAARVALITQAQPRQDLLLQGQSAQHQTQTTGSYDPAHPSLIAAQDLLSPYTLAVAGVDEVTDAGTWAFSSPQSSATSPGWVWQTQRASHQAERYLLATGQAIDAPAIAQALDPIVTLPQVLTQPWQTLPQRWVIVGATPMALVVAQSLRRTGRDVTMVLRDRLLPQEDQVIVHYLQAILEAAGIRLYTHTEIQHVQQLENQQWLQVGNRAIESDRILWAEPAPRIWAGLTIAPGSPQVRANRQLRVEPFRNLYVCGGWLGGYDALELGQYEAAIAVHNCLHRRQRSVDYRAVAWVL